MASIEKSTRIEQGKWSLWDPKHFRLALFMGTYVAAIAINIVLITAGISAVSFGAGEPFCSLASLPALGLTSPFEEKCTGEEGGGLLACAGAAVWNLGLFLVACLILLSISLLGVLLPSRRVSQALYIIFVALLLMGAIETLVHG